MPNDPGTIVLAAYEPDPDLFRTQLRSIQQQTVTDWNCIITVDGDIEPVRELLRLAVGEDERFRLIGGDRLGFVLNFERGLASVDRDSKWVALSDQDDEWYPTKLEQLLPHLDASTLVSGQARLVEHPSGRVLGRTTRRNVDSLDVVLHNQYTGSLCVFRAELLSRALPFPRASTRAAAHDHWLAVVAGAYGGARVVDSVVQDYIQHGANVFGDPSRGSGGGIRGSIRNAMQQAERYEGSSTAAALLRVTFHAYVGWRQLMIETLAARADEDMSHSALALTFGRRRRLRRLLPVLIGAVRRGEVPTAFAAQYLVSWAVSPLIGGRKRALPPAS